MAAASCACKPYQVLLENPVKVKQGDCLHALLGRLPVLHRMLRFGQCNKALLALPRRVKMADAIIPLLKVAAGKFSRTEPRTQKGHFLSEPLRGPLLLLQAWLASFKHFQARHPPARPVDRGRKQGLAAAHL